MAQKDWLMRRGRGFAVVIVMAVVVSACGSSSVESGSAALPLRIENQGGSMEGHTPRGFAGSGIGLFAGDNLNQGFPDGDGVQIWLTFDIPEGTPTPDRVVLKSNVLTVRGTPFADLGALQAEPVSYDLFGPALFGLPATGDAVTCTRVGDDGLECDVSAAVASTVEAGEDRAQFRLKFETAGDNDGAADLAMFFLTDSNTNEPGIFTLNLS
jgi:hypothetical protein